MSTEKYTPRLADKYKKEVVPALMKKFGYKTVMQAPKLTKICLNRGVNGAVADKKLVDEFSKIKGKKTLPFNTESDLTDYLQLYTDLAK